jgi:hypothetical protein
VAARGVGLATRLARARLAAAAFARAAGAFAGRCLTLPASARQANRTALNIRLRTNVARAEVLIGLLLLAKPRQRLFNFLGDS